MTTKKKEASVKQKTTTTEAAEYTPPEEKVSVFSINMEIKDLILGQSKMQCSSILRRMNK